MQKQQAMDVIVLAAGLGTRMRSDLPKVLHRVCGQPMLSLLLEELGGALDPAGGSRFNIVVGHGRDRVIEAVEALRKAGRVRLPVVFTVQEKQLGTAHAVRLALEQPFSGTMCAVFNGDLPLFTSRDFRGLLDAHTANRSAATCASAKVADAGQYGRVLRKGKAFQGVVEAKDATKAQLRIREYNGGVYLFERALLGEAVRATGNRNAAGEFYLPDVFAFARRKKKQVLAHELPDSESLQGVNTMKELALAQSALYARTAERLMAEGVFLAEPFHTYVGPRVIVGRGCAIGPFTSIHGKSVLGDGVRVGAHCELTDVVIDEGSEIRSCTIASSCSVGKGCAVGPMAHLRPGTRLGDRVRVGNFVEIKESALGSGTNAAHLSYVGDAEIGSGVNLGCGFITCNYDGTVRDGKRKHPTVIGDDVFVGSDTQVIAPIRIADGTYIASGSTVTESVSDRDSLVIARTKQVTKPGYAKKYRRAKKDE